MLNNEFIFLEMRFKNILFAKYRFELNKTTAWFAFLRINLSIHITQPQALPVLNANFSKCYRSKGHWNHCSVYKLANDDEPLGLPGTSLQMNPNPNPNSHIGCYRHSQTCTHRSNEIYAYKGMRRIDLRNFNLVASLVKFPNISAIALLLSIVCGVCARSTFLPLLHRFADCCVCNLVLSIAYLPGNYCAINAGLRKFLIAF